MLERDLRALDLPLLRLAAQLPHELGALREARGAERVALREQAARWVRDELAAVGVVAVPDELLGFTFLATGPSASYVSSSFAVKQSWSSTTSMSSGPMPVCSYSFFAPFFAMS